ncbi:hypothetical protein EI94DRAFT_1699641 [Lactarius quietus]|nr:hypothetical protein EI94DRAFT_1699641 [Lactarius quietus]
MTAWMRRYKRIEEVDSAWSYGPMKNSHSRRHCGEHSTGGHSVYWRPSAKDMSAADTRKTDTTSVNLLVFEGLTALTESKLLGNGALVHKPGSARSPSHAIPPASLPSGPLWARPPHAHPPSPQSSFHVAPFITDTGGHAGTGLGAPISGRVRWEASAPRRLWSLPNNLSTNIEQPVKQNEQLFDNNNNAKRRKSSSRLIIQDQDIFVRPLPSKSNARKAEGKMLRPGAACIRQEAEWGAGKRVTKHDVEQSKTWPPGSTGVKRLNGLKQASGYHANWYRNESISGPAHEVSGSESDSEALTP